LVDRIIRNDHDLRMLVSFLEQRDKPFTVSVRKGADRTVDQNRLQRLWCNEAAEQRGDVTAEDVRAECKLRIGVPIMRAASEEFREKYDRIIKPHPYEVKLEMMAEPLDFPVTRIMTTKEKAEYLDAMHALFTGEGFILTEPKR